MADKKHDHPLFAAAADEIIDNLNSGTAPSATDLLAWRAWFDERKKQLRSSGGRPTEPNWTWYMLGDLARASGIEGIKVGPGQLAGFILEEAVLTRTKAVSVPVQTFGRRRGSRSNLRAEQCDLTICEPRFRDWSMPAPFCGSDIK
jgi:hypothetical protein